MIHISRVTIISLQTHSAEYSTNITRTVVIFGLEYQENQQLQEIRKSIEISANTCASCFIVITSKSNQHALQIVKERREMRENNKSDNISKGNYCIGRYILDI